MSRADIDILDEKNRIQWKKNRVGNGKKKTDIVCVCSLFRKDDYLLSSQRSSLIVNKSQKKMESSEFSPISAASFPLYKLTVRAAVW